MYRLLLPTPKPDRLMNGALIGAAIVALSVATGARALEDLDLGSPDAAALLI